MSLLALMHNAVPLDVLLLRRADLEQRGSRAAARRGAHPEDGQPGGRREVRHGRRAKMLGESRGARC